jgi:hypothetical protein
VAYEDNVVGRGRPRRMWSLTPPAVSLFPDTHAQLTVDLIGTIPSELGEVAFSRLLRRRTDGIATNYRSRFAPELDIRGKLAALAELRTAEGYMARLEEVPDGAICRSRTIVRSALRRLPARGSAALNSRSSRSLLGDKWQIHPSITSSPEPGAAASGLPAPRPKLPNWTDTGRC